SYLPCAPSSGCSFEPSSTSTLYSYETRASVRSPGQAIRFFYRDRAGGDSISALTLGAIKRFVGGAKQVIGGRRQSGRYRRDAAADRDAVRNLRGFIRNRKAPDPPAQAFGI